MVADAGYQAVPDVLLYSQKDLGISSEELNVLLNLLAHWWRPESSVFPRPTTIAARMGVSVRTVQRVVSSLEKKGIVRKSRTRDGRTYYDVSPLKELLTPYAETRSMEKKRLAQLREDELLHSGGSEGRIGVTAAKKPKESLPREGVAGVKTTDTDNDPPF